MNLVPEVTTALLASADNGYDMDGTGRGTPIIAQPLRAGRQYSDMGDGQSNVVTHTLRSEGMDASEDGTGRGTPMVAVDLRNGAFRPEDRVGTLQAHKESYSLNTQDALLSSMAVRRLTPTECERLQGFPDGWTAGHSDSGRYRMLGNAVCVPVAEWIGRRMMAYHTPAVQAATRA